MKTKSLILLLLILVSSAVTLSAQSVSASPTASPGKLSQPYTPTGEWCGYLDLPHSYGRAALQLHQLDTGGAARRYGAVCGYDRHRAKCTAGVRILHRSA